MQNARAHVHIVLDIDNVEAFDPFLLTVAFGLFLNYDLPQPGIRPLLTEVKVSKWPDEPEPADKP